MEKKTLEKIENNYKEAIRDKFKIERVEGKHSHYLNNPSQAHLRDLCWEIYSSNPKTDDLSVYRNFFRTEFSSEENTSTQYTDKFKKVGSFYKGEKKAANISTVELAAILVDFHPRPFNKFRKQIDPDDLEIINDLRDTKFFNPQNSSDNLITKVENENVTDSKIEETEQFQSQESEPKEEQEQEEQESISTLVGIVEKPANIIWRYLGITAALVGLGFIIYLASSKKDCIQWTGDHYEKVSCDLKIDGIGTFNSPVPYDERIIDLRRIRVCDTTVFFKNEKAVVWYAKVGDSVEFFNTHGMHPENGKALRAITPYIINKYVVKK